MTEVPGSSTFTVPAGGGAKLHGDCAGSGSPTIVLLHAGIAHRGMWDDQVAALASRHRVVRYDLRGCGESAAPVIPFSHRADLAAVLSDLDSAGEDLRPVLVGASLGGRIALDHAVARPGRLAALVLVGSVPSGFDRSAFPPAPELAEVDAALAASDLDRAADLETRLWLVGPHRRPEQVPAALFERVKAMDRIALAAEAAGAAVEDPCPPALEHFSELALPVLIVCGELDRPDVVAGSRACAARIPGARHVMLPGTAHLPSLEAPVSFNALLLDFLAGL